MVYKGDEKLRGIDLDNKLIDFYLTTFVPRINLMKKR